jgi:hypothetical protein
MGEACCTNGGEEDNVRMDLGQVGWGDVDWIDLIQDRGKWRESSCE